METRGKNTRRSPPTTGIPLTPERRLELGEREKNNNDQQHLQDRKATEQDLCEMNGNCS